MNESQYTVQGLATTKPHLLGDLMERFAWALSPGYTAEVILENLQRIEKELARVQQTIREFQGGTFQPDPEETADAEKAAMASYLESMGEMIQGIGLSLMLRPDLLPTEGIPDGPRAYPVPPPGGRPS